MGTKTKNASWGALCTRQLLVLSDEASGQAPPRTPQPSCPVFLGGANALLQVETPQKRGNWTRAASFQSDTFWVKSYAMNSIHRGRSVEHLRFRTRVLA
jgi:hypothetical protein